MQAPTNLLARLFNIPQMPLFQVNLFQGPPAPQLICLMLPRTNAVNEIRSILRDWRRYGLCAVCTNSRQGTVRATVSEKNSLGMQPVALLATVHAIAVDGNAGGLSVVKVEAEWGNRGSFVKACSALASVLRGRNLSVREKHIAREMKVAFRQWERMYGLGAGSGRL